MSVIESNEYREEVAELVKDRRIIDMAWSIPADLADAFDPESWRDMSLASDEFARRGGNAFSIGGPAKAIRRLLDVIKQEGLR